MISALLKFCSSFIKTVTNLYNSVSDPNHHTDTVVGIPGCDVGPSGWYLGNGVGVLLYFFVSRSSELLRLFGVMGCVDRRSPWKVQLDGVDTWKVVEMVGGDAARTKFCRWSVPRPAWIAYTSLGAAQGTVWCASVIGALCASCTPQVSGDLLVDSLEVGTIGRCL